MIFGSIFDTKQTSNTTWNTLCNLFMKHYKFLKPLKSHGSETISDLSYANIIRLSSFNPDIYNILFKLVHKSCNSIISFSFINSHCISIHHVYICCDIRIHCHSLFHRMKPIVGPFLLYLHNWNFIYIMYKDSPLLDLQSIRCLEIPYFDFIYK